MLPHIGTSARVSVRHSGEPCPGMHQAGSRNPVLKDFLDPGLRWGDGNQYVRVFMKQCIKSGKSGRRLMGLSKNRGKAPLSSFPHALSGNPERFFQTPWILAKTCGGDYMKDFLNKLSKLTLAKHSYRKSALYSLLQLLHIGSCRNKGETLIGCNFPQHQIIWQPPFAFVFP